MKIIIAGGTGYLGNLLIEYYKKEKENQIYILTRKQKINVDNVNYVEWDGVSKGYWTSILNNADVLINLTGKSVNCRYNQKNKDEIYQSRLYSTALLCEIVRELEIPPKVFIQSSSATIYEHSEDKLMTEKGGVIGIDFSMDVCKKWEEVFNSYKFTNTKKIITRTSIVLGKNGGAFPIMKKMVSFGFGGIQGKGNQFISWITEKDYVKAISFLKDQKEGVYNVCAPNPIQNFDFQKKMRQKLGMSFGLNVSENLLRIGAKIIGTEPELVLKSRKVYPENLLKLGFKFSTATFNEFKI